MSDIVERLLGVDHQSIEDCFLQSPLFNHAADEITRLRKFLSEVEKREKDARKKALEEAAKVAILTANHLTILPPSVRKFPEVGGIIAARILELCSPVEEKADEVPK